MVKTRSKDSLGPAGTLTKDLQAQNCEKQTCGLSYICKVSTPLHTTHLAFPLFDAYKVLECNVLLGRIGIRGVKHRGRMPALGDTLHQQQSLRGTTVTVLVIIPGGTDRPCLYNVASPT